ncbi:hypothetical protein Tco_0336191 [Tanacetum coccineum]
MEKDVIRLDFKNKGEVFLALQKEVHDLKADIYVQNIIEEIKEAHKDIISDLQKKVDDPNAQNYKAIEEEFKRVNKERKKGDD